MKKYIYAFGSGTAEGDGTMKDTLGGKGAGLAEMSKAGAPVPPGFTIATQVCNLYFENGNKTPPAIQKEMEAQLAKLEKTTGQKLGDSENPLLVSVRSGAKFSMPGMMDTILNLGLNDKTTKVLAKKSGNPRFAYDCYRRFIQMFGAVVLDIEKDEFEDLLTALKKKRKAKLDTDLTVDDLQLLAEQFKAVVKKKTKKNFPQDARRQLDMARDAVFRSWHNPRANHYRRMEGISPDLGTGVNVQTMVFGNMGETSATGVGFTRNPATGEKMFYGEFLTNAQGEDVVAGIRTPRPITELKDIMPEAFDELKKITTNLEKHYRDIQDFEFTIQDRKLYMLQTRNGKRTGPAAVRIAVEMAEEKLISKKEAVLRVDPPPARSVAAPGSGSEIERLAQPLDGRPAGFTRCIGGTNRIHC